jgi:hypothetical protein
MERDFGLQIKRKFSGGGIDSGLHAHLSSSPLVVLRND